jgi:TRAP-type C4-dicarboxylate transport system permease small subunit
MAGPANQARSSWLDRANRFLVGAAVLSLLFMVAVITAGVAMRYVFAAPILGLNEIVQLTSVAVVMLTLPWATAVGAHVRVDVLDRVIGRSGRFLGDVLSRALSAFVLGVLVWRAALKALDALKYGDATNMLGLPIWPFYAILALGMALCVIVLVVQIAALLAGGPRDD